VDGKPFFGTDPQTGHPKTCLARRRQKVQLYDKKSDQARPSPASTTASAKKPINLRIERRENATAAFGNASAGVGTNDRYAR